LGKLKKLVRSIQGDTVITPAPTLVDGHLLVPDVPGLGVDIVEDEIAEYPSATNVVVDSGANQYEPGTASQSAYFQGRLRRSSLRRTS
jgi:galactonate dehydratase